VLLNVYLVPKLKTTVLLVMKTEATHHPVHVITDIGLTLKINVLLVMKNVSDVLLNPIVFMNVLETESIYQIVSVQQEPMIIMVLLSV
jgi:hypothetical protein